MRMVDYNTTTYWWVPAATITNHLAISAAALTSGLNITQYLVSSTKVGPTGSKTVSEEGIADVAEVIVPTMAKYEGSLTAFRDFTSGVPSANDVLTTIASASGVLGWIVRRTGYASTVAAAAAQLVEAYKFMTDTPVPSPGSGDGFLKAVIPLHPQGTFALVSTLAA